MKVKYLATFAIASLLGVGVATGCSNPCAAKTKTPASSTETELKANPCAGKKENPCASKENPCAGKKENPCASKENPCAGKKSEAEN